MAGRAARAANRLRGPGSPEDPFRFVRKAHANLLDQGEAEVFRAVKKAFEVMESRVLKKAKSTRARKGTRHWDYGADYDPTREKKILDPKKVMDVEAEADDFVAAVMPSIENIVSTFGQGVTQSFGMKWNLRDPGLAADILQRSNRLRGVVDTTWNRVQEAIIDAEAEGETIDGIAKRIGQVFTQAKGYRARVIARTETVGAANAGALLGANQTGVVEKKVWLATVDHRTRSTHVEADGQTVDLKKRFRVGASTLDHPGDPAGGPSEVIQCRCTMLFTRVPPEEDEEIETPEVVGIAGDDVTPLKPRLVKGNVKGTNSIGDVVRSGKAEKPGNPIGAGTKVNKGVNRGRQAIDSVHASPEGLAEIDTFQSSSPTTLGAYSFRERSGEAVQIAVSSKADEQATVFVHEFGHYFDHQDFGDAGTFSSAQAAKAYAATGTAEGPLAEWYEALAQTDTFKRLEELKGSLGKKVEYVKADGTVVEVYPDLSFARYLLDPRELWARSYAQFVSKEAGDPDLWEEMAQQIRGRVRADENPRAGIFPTQWPEDDFAPVAEAMRKIFRDQGLAE